MPHVEADGADAAASGHREIDHTADLGFEVWAEDEAGVLTQATEALCELVYERAGVRPLENRKLAVTGDSIEQRLVRWLYEVYLLAEAGWLTASVTDVRVEDGVVVGRLRGESYAADRHVLHTEVKAVTYHGLEVRRGSDELLRAVVILDV